MFWLPKVEIVFNLFGSRQQKMKKREFFCETVGSTEFVIVGLYMTLPQNPNRKKVVATAQEMSKWPCI